MRPPCDLLTSLSNIARRAMPLAVTRPPHNDDDLPPRPGGMPMRLGSGLSRPDPHGIYQRKGTPNDPHFKNSSATHPLSKARAKSPMTIEDDVKFLERIPTLRIIGPAALRIIAIGSEQRYVHGGEVLYSKDAPADSGYVVQEGGFRLSNELQIGAMGFNARPGTLLAEMALIAHTQHTMTATAMEPSTVIRIPRNLFLKMLEGYPEAARRVRDHVAARIEQSSNELSHIRSIIG